MTAGATTPSAVPVTLDSVAEQILQGRPETLVQLAQRFDAASSVLEDVRNTFVGQLRELDGALRRKRSDAQSGGLASQRILAVLDQLQCPEFGPLLRRGAEALTDAQTQIRDLQVRRQHDRAGGTPAAPELYDEHAVAVRRGVSRQLTDVGEAMPALPGFTALGTAVPTHSAPPPASEDDGGAPVRPDAAARPGSAQPLLVDPSSNQVVVSAAIGRGGALTLAAAPAAAPEIPDLPLGGERAAVDAPAGEVKLPGTGKEPSGAGAPPSAAGGGSSMMPFMMPMGMGMGMGMGGAGGAVGGTRARSSVGVVDVAWDEEPKPGGGEGVLGRKAKPRTDDDLIEEIAGGFHV